MVASISGKPKKAMLLYRSGSIIDSPFIQEGTEARCTAFLEGV